MLLFCTCESEYQDKRYGKNTRVHNAKSKTKCKNGLYWRCTVCARERNEK